LEDEGFRGYLTLGKNMTLCYMKTFFRRNKSGKKTNMKKMKPKKRFTVKKFGGAEKPYMKIGTNETPLNGKKLEIFLENGTLKIDFSNPTGRRVVLKPVDGPTRVAADKYNGPPTPNPLKMVSEPPPEPTGGPGRGNPYWK